jgi:hypothetical protein
VNRPFVLGLASAGAGILLGFAYRVVIQASGHCVALFGLENPSAPCSTSDSWVIFLNVFALVTLVGCLMSGIVIALLLTGHAVRRHRVWSVKRIRPELAI